jgi:hypothetical protein
LEAPRVCFLRLDEDTAIGRPARQKRQTVGYAIMVDTPNTYLRHLLGGSQAIRHGVGVGRDGFA